MDILTFISELIRTVIWPVVILILGLSYRTKITELLPSLSKIKAGPVEAEFDLEVRKLLGDSKEIIARGPIGETEELSSEEQESDISLAKIYTGGEDPTTMVFEGWKSIDGALWRLGKDAGVIVDPMDSMNSVFRTVISTELLTLETKRLVIELYEMRNRVVQANIKPSLNAARDYILAVEQSVRLIEKQRESVKKVGNVKY
ncbi:hypothetical protein [Photobacterium chitinilyticum]|uniref:Uncharacterized protein n=1 Tax=Photobacterium chitinilyticum TaxID=2485123 RepID=A0A3S3QUU1_9GAMM|nr:hypothetical protein [Photobacterium chitinilyticum]RWX57329.1 hypothetical protein EDI28_04675 [Photobacterium chitinilyticum]